MKLLILAGSLVALGGIVWIWQAGEASAEQAAQEKALARQQELELLAARAAQVPSRVALPVSAEPPQTPRAIPPSALERHAAQSGKEAAQKAEAAVQAVLDR